MRDLEHKTKYDKEYHRTNAMLICARKYGIDRSVVRNYAADHSGLCDICGDPPSMKNKNETRLHVDHSHATGEFRGLLCNDCNLLLGRAKDDIRRLEAAIQYLKDRELKEKDMPDLAFSNTNAVTIGWTVQQLSNNTAGQNLGYDAPAPAAIQEKDAK